MLKVIRHRPVQAAVIAALAALVTACAVLTPLYQRALEQASVQVQLADAPASATQLQLTSNGVLPDIYSGSRYARPPLTTEELNALVPTSLRRSPRYADLRTGRRRRDRPPLLVAGPGDLAGTGSAAT